MKIEPRDYNNNGVIDNEDMDVYMSAVKNMGQLGIAWVAMISIIALTVALCGEWISIERVKALQDLFTTVYVALSSLVGAQMGLVAWLKK